MSSSDAKDTEPAQAEQALDAIAALCKVEQQIRDDGLDGQAKLTRRQEQSKPVHERFFIWIDEQFGKQGFLPSSPSWARWRISGNAGSACRSI